MLPRTGIKEMFSTFIELDKDRFSRWSINSKLYQSMENCLDSSPELSREEDFWALYWYKHWQYSKQEQSDRNQFNRLPQMHMQAYFQEPCYVVSQKIVTFLKDSQYSLADFFQMANGEVELILRNFNPQKSSNLKAYFKMAVKSRLRDILRQRKEVDICTNWALLRKVSKKLLMEALDNAGLSTQQTLQYSLAWTCFKQLYVPTRLGGTASLSRPNAKLWQEIANLYNNSRHQLTQQTPFSTAEIIERCLDETIIHLRAYLFPSVKSLNTFNADDDASSALDLADPSSGSLIADIITVEDLQKRQNQISQMLGVLSTAFQAMDIKSQEILKLYYQQELTQQEIMQHLQMSQPTVSRKLVKARESLLGALVKWSQDLNISVNPNQVKDMSFALEEWLRNQFEDFNINS